MPAWTRLRTRDGPDSLDNNDRGVEYIQTNRREITISLLRAQQTFLGDFILPSSDTPLIKPNHSTSPATRFVSGSGRQRRSRDFIGPAGWDVFRLLFPLDLNQNTHSDCGRLPLRSETYRRYSEKFWHQPLEFCHYIIKYISACLSTVSISKYTSSHRVSNI